MFNKQNVYSISRIKDELSKKFPNIIEEEMDYAIQYISTIPLTNRNGLTGKAIQIGSTLYFKSDTMSSPYISEYIRDNPFIRQKNIQVKYESE